MSDALKKTENETAAPLTDEEAAKAVGGTRVTARRVRRRRPRAAEPAAKSGRPPQLSGAEDLVVSSSDASLDPEVFPYGKD